MIPVVRRKSPLWSWFALAGNLAAWTVAQASTVTPMSVAKMADHAGQVIVGRVAAVRSYWADNPRRIETEVTWQEVDYLKGRLAESTDRFTLIVPGGEVDGLHASVCCAPEFRIGEKWVVFLLPSYHTHPVVGIFQGAFLVEPDNDGVERVVSRRHGNVTKVLGIGADGFVQYDSGPPADVHEHLIGADNMRLVEQPAPADVPAISLPDFVAQLTPVLAASRDHGLTAPAGKPALVKLRAVPLQPSRLELQRQMEKRATDPAPPARGQGAAHPVATTQPSTPTPEVLP